MPGEFGGGVINLSSAVIPEEAFLNIKLGTGGNSETTFQPGLTHYGGGDSDLLGYDDGTRKVSAELKDAIARGHRITPGLNFTSDEAKKIARSFTNAPLNLLQTTDSRSEEHTSELQSLMRKSYAVFCLKKKKERSTALMDNGLLYE